MLTLATRGFLCASSIKAFKFNRLCMQVCYSEIVLDTARAQETCEVQAHVIADEQSLTSQTAGLELKTLELKHSIPAAHLSIAVQTSNFVGCVSFIGCTKSLPLSFPLQGEHPTAALSWESTPPQFMPPSLHVWICKSFRQENPCGSRGHSKGTKESAL